MRKSKGMKYRSETDTTVLEAMKHLAPDSSMTQLRSWIKEGRVTVDGALTTFPSAKVLRGQEVAFLPRRQYARGGVTILYQDEDIVVVDKPTHVLTVASATETQKTVWQYLRKFLQPRHPFVVHRLDQGTSGVMVFALHEEAQQALKSLFERHDITREYVAIVEGCPEPPKGTWRCYLWEDPNYFVRVTKDARRGELAITHYTVEKSHKGLSRLSCVLETGKKNQIRVQASQAGSPIVGDKKYGATKDLCERLCLHARRLAFRHPRTGKKMDFRSPEPPEFLKLVPP